MLLREDAACSKKTSQAIIAFLQYSCMPVIALMQL